MNTVNHFRSAGYRARYERGEISFEQATHKVPVRRGFDPTLLGYMRRQVRRAQRKAMLKAQEGITISDDMIEHLSSG